MENNIYVIDTKGICFLCFRKASANRSIASCSFKEISRYLQVDFKKVFSISEPSQLSVLLDKTEPIVSLCKSCSELISNCCQLFGQLSLVEMRVRDCVQTIHNRMISSQVPSLLEEYRGRMFATTPEELIKVNVAENLRKETARKCNAKIGQSLFTKAFEGLKETTTRNSFSNQSARHMKPIPIPPRSHNGIGNFRVPRDLSVFSLGSRPVSNSNPFFKQSKTAPAVPVVNLVNEPHRENERVPQREEKVTTNGDIQINSVVDGHGNFYSMDSKNETSDKPAITSTPLLNNQTVSQVTLDADIEALIGLGGSSSSSINPTTGISGQTPININGAKVLPDGRFECLVCGKTSSSIGNFESHYRIHTGEKPFQCANCPEKFRYSSVLKQHTLTAHRAQLFLNFKEPDTTSEEFEALVGRLFEDIVKPPDGDRLYICVYCPKTYKYKPDMQAHMVQFHYDNLSAKLQGLQKIPSPSGNTIIPTAAPAYASNSMESLLVANRNENENEHAYACNVCGITFASQTHLERHKTLIHGRFNLPHPSNRGFADATVLFGNGPRTSAAPKRFKNNNDCDKFVNKFNVNSLKSARSLDTSSGNSSITRPETVFTCAHCGKRFRFKHSHTIHVLTFHKYAVFSKHIPDGTTEGELETVIELLIDKYRRLPNNVYGCLFCFKEFTENAELKNHVFIAHFDEAVIKLKDLIAKRKFADDTSAVEEVSTPVSKLVMDVDLPPIKIEDTGVQMIIPDDPEDHVLANVN